MAKLHEHQGKSILQMEKIAVPHGGSVDSVEEAKNLADTLSGPVVVKGQAWITGRADLGLIRFADTPDEAYQAAGAICSHRRISAENQLPNRPRRVGPDVAAA